MMDDGRDSLQVNGVPVTDTPQPDLDDLEQRDLPEQIVPAVPVKQSGPVHVQVLPALSSAVYEREVGTTMARVVDYNPRRRAVTVIGADAWRIGRTPAGIGALMPPDVPVRLEHADRIYARAVTSTTTITVIEEIWAD